jgi:hypothetical protein
VWVSEMERQLVADEFAAAVGQDGWAADQACWVLLVATGGRASDTAAVQGDGAKDCRLAGGDGVDAGDGRSAIRGPGRDGRMAAGGIPTSSREPKIPGNMVTSRLLAGLLGSFGRHPLKKNGLARSGESAFRLIGIRDIQWRRGEPRLAYPRPASPHGPTTAGSFLQVLLPISVVRKCRRA